MEKPAAIIDQLDQNRRKVDFDTFDITVKELTNMVDEGIINVAPEYQRQFQWTKQNQSLFIESVFLGIPIPSMFMAANRDGSWEVIDGVQRLSTLIHFCGTEASLANINKNEFLELEGLEKLTSLVGYRFEQLPLSAQRQFLLKSLKVTTISDKSDFEVRFDLFERLNKGGVTLEPQEIRACVYRGEFNTFLRELASGQNFNSVVNLTKRNENNGTKEELVLKFFAYFYEAERFEHSVVDFLNDYMKRASRSFEYREARKIFETVFATLSDALPDGIYRGRHKTTPVNLYEAVAVGAARSYYRTGRINVEGLERFLNDDMLKRLTTGATNSRKMVVDRIEYCADFFSR